MDRPAATSPLLDRRVPIVLFADEWGGIGGTAGYVVMLSRQLCRRGYPVVALCHGGEGTSRMRDELAATGVQVEILPSGGGPALLRRFKELAYLIRVLRRHRRGVLVLMMGYFTRGGGVTLAGRLASMRAIVRADLTPPEPPITRRSAFFLRLKDILTNRVVVGALENVVAFRQEAGRRVAKMRIIHTGIELDRFEPGKARDTVRQELGYAPTELVAGTVARLDDERKGVASFLRAAGIAGQEAPDLRFLIVGEGVHRPAYEALAGELGIPERVTFTGWRSDVPRLLDAMDIFVMPSYFEGGPTSVIEAMAMARPVIATRVGMVPEIIEDGVDGVIVAPGDVEAMAQALCSLAVNADLRHELGANARDRALSSLGISRMTDEYLELFGSLTSESVSAGDS
jgi:glycosyltransferase involved in cell wall biosynthesis